MPLRSTSGFVLCTRRMLYTLPARSIAASKIRLSSPVAADGSVWVALAHAGCVAVFEPDGSPRLRLPVPLPMVTNLCFGGADLRDLYVVTGSERGPKENCGTVFRTRVDVPGRLRPPARVALTRLAAK